MRALTVVALFSSALVSFAACGDSTSAPTGPACGDVICDEGLICCNASCGICTPRGGSCTGELCVPPTCERSDAEGVGDCDEVLGWVYDGGRCVPVEGCNCGGRDCYVLFEEAEHCKDQCEIPMEGESCGGFTGAECEVGQYCKFESECMGAGVCVTIPEDCIGTPADVCGCNGETYTSSCAAYTGGTDIAHTGACFL